PATRRHRFRDRIEHGCWLCHQMRNILNNRVVRQSFASALPTVSTLLDTAKRRLRDRRDEVVDRKIPHLYFLGQPISIVSRTRKGVRRKPIGQGVRLLDSLIQRIDGVYERKGTKRLLPHRPGIIWHVRENGERKEIAAVSDSLAARQKAGTFRLGIGHEHFHRL